MSLRKRTSALLGVALLGLGLVVSTALAALLPEGRNALAALTLVGAGVTLGSLLLLERAVVAQSQQALEQSEERYRTLVETSPDAITVTDLDARVILVNEQGAQIHGFKHVSEMLGRNALDLVLPDDRARARAHMAEVRTKGSVRQLEYTGLRPDGSTFPMEVSASYIRDAAGNPKAFIGVTRDISERKRAEEAERDQRLLAEALRDTAAALVSTLDEEEVLERILTHVTRVVPYDNATILMIEDGLARVVGYRGRYEAEIREAIPLPLVVDELPNLRTMVETGQPAVISNVKTDPNWVEFPMFSFIHSSVGAPIRAGEQVIGFLTLDSVTPDTYSQVHAERLQAFADQAGIAIHNARLFRAVRIYADEMEQRVSERTAELEQERLQLGAILDAMSEGLLYTRTLSMEGEDVLAGSEFETRYTNAALTRLTGYSAEEWRSLKDILRSGSRRTDAKAYAALLYSIYKTVSTEGIWNGEMIVRRKDGSEFEASLTCTRVPNANERELGIVSMMRDISQEKALQAQTARFITNASHELRTPITNIKTRLYLLRRQPEKLEEHLNVIEDVSNRMRAIVQDLLDISRFQHGVLLLRRETVSLQALIAPIVETQQPEAEDKGLQLTCDMPPEPLMVNADPQRLSQAITNLLTNALNYTPAGGSVRLRMCGEGGQATIAVEDDGVGIAPEHLAHIFKPFFRVGDDGQGTGLGLSITREIVEAHGGEITVESEPGRGSVFTITLALAP